MLDDLFVFGDDFEVILGILEEDEALEDGFTATEETMVRLTTRTRQN